MEDTENTEQGEAVVVEDAVQEENGVLEEGDVPEDVVQKEEVLEEEEIVMRMEEEFGDKDSEEEEVQPEDN